jgi:diguanylate cyclase (GGDEF)-like protein/PAS domain S-box-containing protein
MPASPNGFAVETFPSFLELSSILESAPLLLPPHTSIMQAAQQMKAVAHTCVLVMQGPIPMGLFTEQEVLDAVATGINIVDTPISFNMVSPVQTLCQSESLAVALQLMQDHDLRYLPVEDGQGSICGLVTRQRLYRTLFGRNSQGFLEELASITTHCPTSREDPISQEQIRASLSAAEARFQAIFEQISVGICQATLDGKLFDANPGLCRMLGYSQEELTRKTFQQITHPDDMEIDLGQYERLLAGEQDFMFVEKRYLHKQGHPIWVALTVCLVRDGQGNPLFSIGVSQDISDRKAAEMALRFSEERFALAIHDSKVGVWDWDLHTDELYISANLIALLGYDTAPAIATMADWQQHIHPADTTATLSAMKTHLLGQTSQFEHTYRMQHRDGSLRWILSRGMALANGPDAPQRMAGTHTDITDLKETEAALQDSHKRITNILESITDAFFALDRNWCFTYINQRAEQFLQQQRQQLLNRNIWQEFPEIHNTLFYKEFQRAMAERLSLTFEDCFGPGNYCYEVHIYPTHEGLAVYFQDITQRKLAYQKVEHQIRREKALNRVIQTIRQSLDLDTIFETAALEIATLLQTQHVNIQMFCPEQHSWTIVAEYQADPDAPSLLNVTIVDTNNPIAQKLKQLEMVEINQARDWYGAQVDARGQLPNSWLMVPLHTNSPNPWGCLSVQRSPAHGPWQASEIDLVQTIADQLAIAIQQAQTLSQAQRELQERQRAEARLKEAQRMAQTGSWEFDLLTEKFTWSEEMFRIYGLAPQQSPLSLEQQLALLNPEDSEAWQQQLFLAQAKGHTINIEGTIKRPNGLNRVVHLLGQAQRDQKGEVVSLVGTLSDITKRKQIEDRLIYQALHDPLTHTPNRTYFMEQLHAAVAHAKQSRGTVFAVLFIDLDRFKVINDSLGHLVGDQLLIECAQRLQSVVRENDMVARLGGDEFAILLNHIVDIVSAQAVADRVHEVLQAPFILEDQEIFISASIGIASNITGAVEAVDFLRDADTAMYKAKEHGRGGSALFNSDMYDQVNTRMTLENDMQRALERNELKLHYQPIIDLADGHLVGFEALVRWNHSRWGYISPATFIPMAEETGLILSIGQWIQFEACQQLHQWQLDIPEATALSMSVNLSAKQFASKDLLKNIDTVLTKYQLSNHHLRLEITESALIDHAETAESILSSLRERGIQLCIDDFGTGYSSLSMVHQFPVQVLKIDRSFINRMDADSRGVAMVQAILALANSLGMLAIAEGVETDSQLRLLRKLGCPLAQGYRFAKPLPADEAKTLLQTWDWSQHKLDSL